MNTHSELQSTTHRRFVEFAKDFYRHAGWDEPLIESDAHTPVAFEVLVDDLRFSIGYDPSGGDACLFVYCVFGRVFPAGQADMLLRLLECNLSLMRLHNATCCIDAATGELVCYARKTMDMERDALQAQLEDLARELRQWRGDGLEGQSRHPAPGEVGLLSTWPGFA
jgi:hypothetical protein